MTYGNDKTPPQTTRGTPAFSLDFAPPPLHPHPFTMGDQSRDFRVTNATDIDSGMHRARACAQCSNIDSD